MKTLTINQSNEWLQVFSAVDFDGVAEEDRDSAADDFTERLTNALESAGFDVTPARGQYRTCHGWNGANTFAQKFGPVATHNQLSDSDVIVIHQCIDSAEESMRCGWIESVA